jgi:general secretion pathway protein D
VRRWGIGSCALAALLALRAASAQEIALDFRGVDLPRVVDAIARETGQRFVYDDSLRGNVTISVPLRVSPQEALRVLDATLLLHGFAALPGPGGVRKIVRIEGAAGAAPWLERRPESGSEAAVTTLIRLSAASAPEVAQTLRGLLGKGGVISDDPRTNSILIAASEAHVRRLLHLARALDEPSERELRVLPLRYRDAGEIDPLLEEALADETALAEPVRVTGDPRTGSIVIEGRREDLERARALLRALDVPQPGKRGLHVVRVLNADAEKLADSLDALVQGGELGFDPQAEPVRVVVDPPTHSLVIQAPPDAFAALARVIGELDVVPPRLSVELMVVEVSWTGDLSLGFDSLLAVTGIPDDAQEVLDKGVVIVGTGKPGNVLGQTDPPDGVDGNFVATVTTEPLLIPVDDDTVFPIALGGIVRADRGEARFHTVIRPHLVMTSGEEHRIQAGDNIPVPVSSAATPTTTEGVPTRTSSGLTTDVTFQRQDTGVDLRMTPTVLSDQAVSLVVELTVSELAGTSADLGPTITTRDLSVSVRLRDGQIALIGALRDPQRTETVTGVPFLSRIPILGQLFTERRDIQSRRALIITAQPTVLGSPEEELARSIRQRLAFERHVTRTRDLALRSDAPWALLVDTTRSASAARALAASLRDSLCAGGPIEVVRWQRDGESHWDVYVTGLQTLSETGAQAIALRDAGWQPALVVVPDAEP